MSFSKHHFFDSQTASQSFYNLVAWNKPQHDRQNRKQPGHKNIAA
jgi:hypothetical protein